MLFIKEIIEYFKIAKLALENNTTNFCPRTVFLRKTIFVLFLKKQPSINIMTEVMIMSKANNSDVS